MNIAIVKAGPIANNAPEDLTIEFSGEPPKHENLKWPEMMPVANAWFEKQAATLGSALINTLPGGTLDRLICFMLRQKASYFRVPYVEPTKERHINQRRQVDLRPYLERMKKADEQEEEIAHMDADTVLCDLLNELGFDELVAEYRKIKKWYA